MHQQTHNPRGGLRRPGRGHSLRIKTPKEAKRALTPRIQRFSAPVDTCHTPPVQSAKLNGHDPYAYLKDVLARLPTQKNSQIEDLLPHRWQPTPT
jgi:hypothetical protein